MIDNFPWLLRGMLNVRMTSYRKLFCLARLRDCFRRTRQRGQESKVFFKATLQILNLNRKIFIASVEQSGSTRSKYIFLHVTFLSSYKTNRLHFAERLFSFKKRNKTKKSNESISNNDRKPLRLHRGCWVNFSS